jgi:hypothetical protein
LRWLWHEPGIQPEGERAFCEARHGPAHGQGRATIQVCGVDAVQLTRFAKKPVRTGSES